MQISKTTAVLGAVFIAFVFFCLGYFFSGGRVAESYLISTEVAGEFQAGESALETGGNGAQSAAQDGAAESGGTAQPTEDAPYSAANIPDGESAAVSRQAEDLTGAPEPTGPININTVSAQELEALPGIGEVLAQRIVDYRETYGAYQSIIDLKNVEGIGDKRFEAIENMVCVD